MTESYSIYDAKARFSEIMRKVRRNRRITVTCRGVPVAEIVPLRISPEPLEQRLDRLEREGTVEGCKGSAGGMRTLARKRGALARFLGERE